MTQVQAFDTGQETSGVRVGQRVLKMELSECCTQTLLDLSISLEDECAKSSGVTQLANNFLDMTDEQPKSLMSCPIAPRRAG